jgi:thioredoxin-related protein
MQLVMVEEHGCVWCEQWNEDISGIYPKTEEGQKAPLRRIDIHDDIPADLEFSKSLHYTPTFVLMKNGREAGRIEGYPGEDFFWGLLGRLLDQANRLADS